MSFLKNVFKKKDSEPAFTYTHFWRWFHENEQSFRKVIQTRENIEKDFFDKLSPQLEKLHSGLFFLAGMLKDGVADLIITPDGNISNFYKAEEFVKSAPKIEGWKFTALKPAVDIPEFEISMNGYSFTEKNISFYSNESAEYPDEIDLTFIYTEPGKTDMEVIRRGVFIYLDNYLGELEFATSIDNLNVMGLKDAVKELVPVTKLKDFLIWREKEFVEKYNNKRRNTENDAYSSFQAQLNNGMPVFGIVNSDVLNWDSKASHPWMMVITTEYEGNENGMPDQDVYSLMTGMEEMIDDQLKDSDGYLNVARETGAGVREIYYACADFRTPAKVMDKLIEVYKDKLNVSFEIYKDKYWKSLERYQQG